MTEGRLIRSCNVVRWLHWGFLPFWAVVGAELEDVAGCCEAVDVPLDLECLLFFAEFIAFNLKFEQVDVLESRSLLMPELALRAQLLPLLIEFGPICLELLLAIILPGRPGLAELALLFLKLLMLKPPVIVLILKPLRFFLLECCFLSLSLLSSLLRLLGLVLRRGVPLFDPSVLLFKELLSLLPGEVGLGKLLLFSFLEPLLSFPLEVFLLFGNAAVLVLRLPGFLLLPLLAFAENLLLLTLILLLIK